MKVSSISTFTVRTDVPVSSPKSSGILHASQPHIVDAHQKHVFMWITDVNFIKSAVGYFAKLGYKDDNLVFIPFTSKENWKKSYPYALPSCECSREGTVFEYQPAAVKTSANVHHPKVPTLPLMSETKKRKRGGPRISKVAVLTNDLRDELHIQMYKYFQWLFTQLNSLQLTSHGRILLSECGCTVLGIQTILSAFESVLGIVKSLSTSDGVVQESEEAPLLEHALEDYLGQRADERLASSKPEAYHLQKYDFDQEFQKLIEYKDQNGHCNVPVRYKEDRRLGKWVSKLREKKTELSKKGEEYEVAKSITGRTLLKERVERLDAIGFEWRVKTTPTVSWESRFQDLIEYYQTHGRWPLRYKSGSLGHWTHNQRNLYAKKDKYFMKEKYHRLNEIGFDWDPTGVRAAKEISWDDGFKELAAFKENFGHFEVPRSFEDQENGLFYKWVHMLHTEYKSFKKGHESKILNDARILSLVKMGFKFRT